MAGISLPSAAPFSISLGHRRSGDDNHHVVDAAADLEQGREAYARTAWLDAFAALSSADQAQPLGAEDLELLARSAYMIGRDDVYVGGLERAHQAYMESGEGLRAVRCAFWIGHNLLFSGETALGTGWFARADRMLVRERGPCVERGYLMIPVWLGQLAGGDYEAARATTAQAVEIGERFRDPDLVGLATDDQGCALLRQGRVEEGLRLVDEVMVAATAGELSPIVTGIVYCNTINFCQGVFELGRAREWTEALTRWCERQPEMVAHNGLCLVHRAEVMQRQGAWADALAEARVAAERFTEGVLNQIACGKAHYRQGEIHRLRGEFDKAEAAYQDASRCGCEPQPGLALLRLAQGNGETGAAAIRRAVSETIEPLKRAQLLPAYVEIMLGVGDIEIARVACRELDEIAASQGSEALTAIASGARGAVALADGDPQAALGPLRDAWSAWQELEGPYEAAQLRMLLGLTCRALGDEDTAAMELEAARGLFERLGATPDLARAESLAQSGSPVETHGLSARELEVLCLVASGKSNREVAAELVISEHTVARHLENIFAKLGVSSRTAASAFAFAHDLV